MDIRQFYRGKKILITGSTGFKGSRLSLWLHDLGAEVIGYSLPSNTNPNNFKILSLDKKISQVYGDIRDIDTLEKTMDQYKPDMIFHLAAQPLVRDSYKDPAYTMDTNVMGTVNILEMIRKKEYVFGAVLITTDKVYDNNEWIRPYRENDKLGGFDPYSSSKAMCEIAINAYMKSFFKNDKKIAIVRAGNVIGGGDWSKDRLIPDIVKSIMQDEVLTIRNPNAVRPWQYVLEALYGYLLIGVKIFEGSQYEGAYNFGPDIIDTLQVVDIVEKAIEVLGKGKYQIVPDPAIHEAGLLLLDNTKAKTLLGWKSKYNVQEVLEKTLKYYKACHLQQDIEALALAEIHEFIL